YKISNAYQPTRSHRGQPLEAPQLAAKQPRQGGGGSGGGRLGRGRRVVPFRSFGVVASPVLLWRRRWLCGRRLLVGVHGEALAIEHRHLAGPLAFDQRSADFRGRRSVSE